MAISVSVIDGMDQSDGGDLTRWAEMMIQAEGVLQIGTTPLNVEEQGTPDMSVLVKKGQCFVLRDAYVDNDGTQKFWHVTVEDDTTVNIDNNSSGSTRIDRIAVKIDTAAAVNDEATNVATLVAVKGTPGAGAPTVPDNHLGLSQVSVSDGETAINTGDITDERSFSGYKVHNFIDFPEVSAPADPSANTARMYSKDDGGTTKLYFRDSGGTETEIGGSGGGASWTEASTWSYNAYDSTYKVATITVPSDATATFQPGMRVRFTQPTDGQKYGIIVDVPSTTTIDVFMGTDYDFDNEAVTSPAYSSDKIPFGFDADPNKWKVETTDATQNSATSGTTWGNSLGLTIAIPKGAWDVEYMLTSHLDMNGSTSVVWTYFTLSTATTSESDSELTASANFWQSAGSGSGDQQSGAHIQKRKMLKLASNTTYNLISKTNAGSFGGFWARGDYAETVIRAVCAYL